MRRITPSHHDFEDFVEFTAQRSVRNNTNANTYLFITVICILLAIACVFVLPTNLIDIKNFNGKCAMVFIIGSILFSLLRWMSNVSDSHQNNNIRRRHHYDRHH